MKINHTIVTIDNVTLIILNDAPSDICFFASVFESLAAAGINIDMISQEPPQGTISRISFTISDNDLRAALAVIAKLREVYPSLNLAVSSGNYKLLVCSNEMRNTPGVASAVLRAAASANADVRLITTSEIDISILLSQPDLETVRSSIEDVLSSND